MKTLLKIFALFLFITSCAPSVFYQIYQTDYEGIKKSNELLFFEDENCKISYNLWQEFGNFGFLITNKTDKDILLYLKECFFIENGIAYDYFQNRVFSDMTSVGSTTAIGTQKAKAKTLSKSISGNWVFNTILSNSIGLTTVNSAIAEISSSLQKSVSTSYQEKDIIFVPANSSRYISEFKINTDIFRHCDLLLFPEKKETNKVTFTKEKSPFIFSNRITYNFNNEIQNKFTIENKFWVSEITNKPSSEVTKTEYEEFCGEKSTVKKTVFSNPGPDKFYIKYNGNPY